MKYKLFVLSDIHGHLSELIEALNDKGFDKNNDQHKLIVCGDLFDRGTQNVQVFLYLYNLSKNQKAIVLKGNHDIFFKDLEKEDPSNVHFNYQYNQFDKTISEFSKINIDDLLAYTNKEILNKIKENSPTFLPWLNSLPFYYETKNYIFTHAGMQMNVPLVEQNWEKNVWMKSEYLEYVDLRKYSINKTLVMGHRPTILLGKENFDIHYSEDGQKIYIDGGVAYNGKMNILVIDNEELI